MDASCVITQVARDEEQSDSVKGKFIYTVVCSILVNGKIIPNFDMQE